MIQERTCMIQVLHSDAPDDILRRAPGRPQIPERRRLVPLRESHPRFVVDYDAVVIVSRRRQIQERLKKTVQMCCVIQIRSACDARDILEGVIDNDTKVISRRSVFPCQNGVANQTRNALRRHRNPASAFHALRRRAQLVKREAARDCESLLDVDAQRVCPVLGDFRLGLLYGQMTALS